MALTKITTSVIAANTLATGNIADNSVDATKIASNSILTRHIDDDQITGDQLADNITIAGNLTVSGNLTTNGSSVTNSSTNTTIEDALIELGTGTSGSPSNDSGIIIERGSSDNVFIGFDESADKVMVATTSATGASTGNLTLTAAPLVTGALTASGLSYPTSDGSSGQVLKTDGSGSLSFAANATSVSNYTATGNGSTTAFDTGTNPTNEINTWVFIDGVYQQKSEYSYSGSTITFSTAPENGAKIDVVTGVTTGIQDSETVLGVFEATTTATDTYATSLNAAHENNTWVFVGGVYQPKDSYTFSTSGSLVFDANTPAGEKLAVVTTKALTASAVTTDSIAASAVTTAKIADNAITSAKIPNNSIVGADISATTNITANAFTGALTGNVTGNVTGNLTGTIQTAAQGNITSLGTLTGLTVNGAAVFNENSADVDFRIESNGNANMLFVDGGNDRVGINGTGANARGGSNTVALFDISGSGKNYVEIQGATDSTANGLLFSDGSSGNYGVLGYNHASDSMNFFTAGSERMRITADGNLGLGDSSPANFSGYVVASFADSTGAILDFKTTGSEGVFARIQGAVNNGLYITNEQNYPIALNTNATERMRITGAGNVGIGTSSPATILHAKAGGDAELRLEAATNSDARVRFGDATDNDLGYIGFNRNSGYMNFSINNTQGEHMRIDSAGDLTVGTSSLGFHFDVSTQLFSSTFGTGGNLTLACTNSSGSGVGGEIFLGGSTRGDSLRNCIVFRRASGTQSMLIDASGNVTIAGSLSKGSGSFKIDHPLESKKDTHHLVHSFVEGPQADNIYRGVVALENGSATINLDTVSGMTEGTFAALNTNTSCFTSNETDWDSVKGSISGNTLTISCQNTSSTATVSWLVIGERHDQHMKDTDWTDSDGKVIVEPLKESE